MSEILDAMLGGKGREPASWRRPGEGYGERGYLLKRENIEEFWNADAVIWGPRESATIYDGLEAAKRAAAPLRRSGEPWVQIVPIRGR
jgi:hypothetical protein